MRAIPFVKGILKTVAECASEVCSGITVLHCTKEAIETTKSHLDKAWNKKYKVIQSIPGTRKSHFFKKVEPKLCMTTSNMLELSSISIPHNTSFK